MPRSNENHNPNDIRNYMTPPRIEATPTRRRRIVTSSDSDDEPSGQPNTEHVIQPAALAAVAQQQNVTAIQDVVELTSSDDDSMYIPLPRARQPAAVEQSKLPAQPRTPNNARANTPRPATRSTAGTPKTAGSDQHSGNKRSRPQQRGRMSSIIGEAEEASSDDEDDHTSECVESDTHGEDLYRQAIAGCRNATKARTQLRASTTKCRVCAKFAAFLDHFL